MAALVEIHRHMADVVKRYTERLDESQERVSMMREDKWYSNDIIRRYIETGYRAEQNYNQLAERYHRLSEILRWFGFPQPDIML